MTLLEDKLREAAVEHLSRPENIGRTIKPKSQEDDRDIIAFLYEKGIIDDDTIDEAHEKAVIAKAQEYHKMLTSNKGRYTIYADHVVNPELLAYALEKGVFSRKQVKRIPFDHGENPEIYVQEYRREDLFDALRENLLHPKDTHHPENRESDGHHLDENHPVCDCEY